MKPKEYVTKYIDKHKPDGLSPKHTRKDFVQDLTADFKALIELHEQVAWNFTKFRVCVKDMRLKFDSIARRADNPKINEKLWSYFYATVVGPLKDEMFPEMKKERKPKQDKAPIKKQQEDAMERRRVEGLKKEREARMAATA